MTDVTKLDFQDFLGENEDLFENGLTVAEEIACEKLYKRVISCIEHQIADLKANFDYVLEGKDLEIKQLGERCNQLLKDKGDLTDELAKWKEEWQEQVQKATDEGWERTKLTGRVRELEQQIEKMKCCGNCDHYRWSNGEDWCNDHYGQPMYDEECKGKWKLRR